MLLSYFGFREDPFGVTPDARFMYEAASHREALASLLYGIGSGRGFLTLLAEPGMGKTSLLHALLERVQHTARTAFVFQTQCDSRELLGYLLSDLDIDYKPLEHDVVSMHRSLNELLLAEAQKGRRCVAVIDEAQNLDDEVLESVRLLSDFETGKSKLLQIVLAGQPGLAERLASPRQEQLRQRISTVNWLMPLISEEVPGYIAHRLRVAGYRGPSLFGPEAEQLISEHSQGIPRNINNLCFNALAICCAENRRRVEPKLIEEVLRDLRLEKPKPQETDFPQTWSSRSIIPPAASATASVGESIPSAMEAGKWPCAGASQSRFDYLPKSESKPVSASYGYTRESYTRESTARLPELAQAIPVQRLGPVPVTAAASTAPVARFDRRAPGASARPSAARNNLRTDLKVVAAAAIVAVALIALGLAGWHLVSPTKNQTVGLSDSAGQHDANRAEAEMSGSYPSTDNLGKQIPPKNDRKASFDHGNSETTTIGDDATDTDGVAGSRSRTLASPPPASLTPGMGSFSPRQALPDSEPPSTLSLPDNRLGTQSIALSIKPAMPVFSPPVRTSPPPRMAAPVPRPSTSEDSISEIVRKPVKLVRPTYPQAARNARVGGEVELQALVGTDGKVEKVTVLSGHPMLVSAAADAVRGWRFEPLTINGRAVEFSTRVIIKFSLTGSES